MSTFEMPAGIALLLVMANLALCLGSLDRRQHAPSSIVGAHAPIAPAGISAAAPGKPKAIGRTHAR